MMLYFFENEYYKINFQKKLFINKLFVKDVIAIFINFNSKADQITLSTKKTKTYPEDEKE